jgi:hypothetical protein
MNLKHRSDIAMIADSLLLDTKQVRYLGKLETGMAMVKLQGRWFEPFLVKFPLVKVKKGIITDDMLKSLMKAWFKKCEVLRSQEAIIDEESGQNEVSRVSRGTAKGEKKGTEKPAKFEELLLRDIVDNRYSPSTERYRRLGLNDYQGKKAREALARKGLIEVKDLATRTGRIKLMVLTDKGKEVARGLGINAGASWRKGGLDHEYWKDKISRDYRSRGYRVIEEYALGEGKAVDLVAMKEGKGLAIEIETGKSDAIYNIRKCLDAGFDRVLCVVTNEKAGGKIERQLGTLGVGRERVSVISAGDAKDLPQICNNK